jgi:hypothetical protein
LAEFAPRFVEGHARATGQKPTSIECGRADAAQPGTPVRYKSLDELTHEDLLGLETQRSHQA